MLKTPEYYERKIQTMKNGITACQKKIASYERTIMDFEKELAASREQYKMFKYNVGQAVFHKEFGNCLITERRLKLQQRVYCVMDITGTVVDVREHTIIPVSQATEILLNNKIQK
jgi:hypothetical protein